MNILELQRNEEVAEGEYKQFERSTKQAGIDEALGPGRVSGIKDAELPTPPAREGPEDDEGRLEPFRLLFCSGIGPALCD